MSTATATPPAETATTVLDRPLQTVPALLARNAADHPGAPAVSWKVGDGTRTLSWSQYRERVLDVAAGLVSLGLGEGGVVAVLASNRVEHLLTDLATTHCRAVTVSIYPTVSSEQAEHILADCTPTVLIIEGANALRRFADLSWVRENAPTLISIDHHDQHEVDGIPLTFDFDSVAERGARTRSGASGDELNRRIDAVSNNDLATLIYTSGTTGMPKGVELTHDNLLFGVSALMRSGMLDVAYRTVSHLPLAHIVERLWSIHLAMIKAGHVYCCPEASQLLPSLQAHRPSWFFTVPRIWEKLSGAVEAVIASPGFAPFADQIAADRQVLNKAWLKRRHDEPLTVAELTAAAIAREGPLREVKAFLGLDQAVCPASGAAALRADTAEFFAAISIDIFQGYGLTETSGAAAMDRPGLYSDGAVGLTSPGFEARIAADGEIQVRGRSVTRGYHNDSKKTEELFEDGWLRTGDIGRIDEAGRLFITDRKKEIIVTASGKNIAPTAIEDRIAGRSFIFQAIVHGEGKPYLTALLTADEVQLRRFASAANIPDVDVDQLLQHPVVLAEAQRVIDVANTSLSRPEQVKSFVFARNPFTIETGELTPTFKIRRSVVADKYMPLLDRLYQTPRALPV